MQLASYLEGGPLIWMMTLHLHVNLKSDYDIAFIHKLNFIITFVYLNELMKLIHEMSKKSTNVLKF